MPVNMTTPTSVGTTNRPSRVEVLGKEFGTDLFKDEQEYDNFLAGRQDTEATDNRSFELSWLGELSRRACVRQIDRLDAMSRETARLVLDDLCARALPCPSTYSSAMAFGLLVDWLLPTLEVDRAELLAMRPEAVMHEAVLAMTVGLELCHTHGMRRCVKKVKPRFVAMAAALTRRFARVDVTGLGMDDKRVGRSWVLGVYIDPCDRYVYERSAPERQHRVRDFTYDVSKTTVRDLMHGFFRFDGERKSVEKAVTILESYVPIVLPLSDERYAFACDCIVERATGQVIPYDPSKIVLHKSPINYVAAAPEPEPLRLPDGSPITFDALLDDVFGAAHDPDVHEFAWEVLSAAACPHLDTGRALLLVSDEDAAGRRALCQLLSDLIGPDVMTLGLDWLPRSYVLPNLVGKAAIVTHSADTFSLLSRSSIMKSLITGDIIMTKRKYETPIPLRARMFMAFSLDDAPVSSGPNSLMRRIITIPFGASVADGCDARALEEWLSRDDVLEYVYSKAVTWNWLDGDGHFVVPVTLNVDAA